MCVCVCVCVCDGVGSRVNRVWCVMVWAVGSTGHGVYSSVCMGAYRTTVCLLVVRSSLFSSFDLMFPHSKHPSPSM